MMDTAKLFQSGNSQAIRLPKAYQMPGKKVYLKRVGDAIMVIPENNGWGPFLEALSEFDEDFMADWKPLPPETRPELDKMFE